MEITQEQKERIERKKEIYLKIYDNLKGVSVSVAESILRELLQDIKTNSVIK